MCSFGLFKVSGYFCFMLMKELNIGGSLVASALEESCGTNRSKIREMYNNLGDLGMCWSIICVIMIFQCIVFIC